LATIRDKLGHWPGSHFATAVEVSSHSVSERERDGEWDGVLSSPVSVTTPEFFSVFQDPQVSRPVFAQGKPSSELPPDVKQPKPLAGSPDGLSVRGRMAYFDRIVAIPEDVLSLPDPDRVSKTAGFFPVKSQHPGAN
jgi:hypothetical protein